MQTVMNRVDTSRYPDNVTDVIFDPHQFDVKKMESVPITQASYDALEAVKLGNYTWFSGLYFESEEGHIWEQDHEYLFSYGGHDFYK